MTLTRQQIEKLIFVYNHFHEIQEFSVTVDENDGVSVQFNLNSIPIKYTEDESGKKFIPQVYK
ncbi:MAG: hypothetical protein EBU08_04795 [Micrococcales bacterium]|nr:hypothetical protein [Micrococcales bacterium]